MTVVVPTFNERENLAPLAARVFGVLDPAATEMIVVDDDSPDGTAAEAERLAQQYPLRCGGRPNACQIRTTALCDRPTALARLRVLHCLAFFGMVSSVRVTAACT